ncbi:nuclease-related domain-containing protein [Salinisphaera hydrothermalis]|uniref:nuclease-related domain-containing protein n=1 Tax=Salinisphaera hydrothermalis TaxID=563188 RepID=UPI00333FF951
MLIQLGVLVGTLAIVSPPFFIVLAQIHWNGFRDKQTGRRHPITRGMLRPPGHALSEKRRESAMNVMYYMAFGPMTGFIALATVFGVPYFSGEPASNFLVYMAIVATLGVSTWAGLKLRRLLVELQALRLGWEGEVATAEELNKLMRDGFEVFHDLPCERFNIDHVVVGPTGVFAVETKTRSKQKRADDVDNDYTAIFDGEVLDFAGWRDRRCLEQARRQAKWLSDWLTSAPGERTVATPAIAIPGWRIERLKGSTKQSTRVFTPREAKSLVRNPTMQPLDHGAMKRIVHQLDQRCRQDLVPRSAGR